MLITNRDLSKMVDYYKKGSNPTVLANTVKDLDKSKARFIIANAMGWNSSANEFYRRCKELGLSDEGLSDLKREAAEYELPAEYKQELEDGPSLSDAQKLRSWFPRLFNVLRSHGVNGFKLENRQPIDSELDIDRRNGRCYTLAYTLKFPYKGRDIELKVSNHSNEGGGSYGVSSPTLNLYQSTQSELADKAAKYLDELPEVASNIKRISNAILEGANIREALLGMSETVDAKKFECPDCQKVPYGKWKSDVPASIKVLSPKSLRFAFWNTNKDDVDEVLDQWAKDNQINKLSISNKKELPQDGGNVWLYVDVIVEGKAVKEAKKVINVKQLETELDAAIKEYMMAEGFPEDEVKDYSRLTVTDTPDKTIIEVGAELSYDGMMDLSDALDKVVTKYDKDAYFDAEDAGLLSAYIFK